MRESPMIKIILQERGGSPEPARFSQHLTEAFDYSVLVQRHGERVFSVIRQVRVVEKPVFGEQYVLPHQFREHRRGNADTVVAQHMHMDDGRTLAEEYREELYQRADGRAV